MVLLGDYAERAGGDFVHHEPPDAAMLKTKVSARIAEALHAGVLRYQRRSSRPAIAEQ
jgi:hypothetical protein